MMRPPPARSNCLSAANFIIDEPSNEEDPIAELAGENYAVSCSII